MGAFAEPSCAVRDVLRQSAHLCASLFDHAGSHVALPVGATHVAALGDSTRAGLLAAAIELRSLLAKSPEGAKALRDLGFERVAQGLP